jgi:hypothetical protein
LKHKFFFIATHLGSDNWPLSKSLMPLAYVSRTDTNYDHPEVLFDFYKRVPYHRSMILGDHLMHNFSLSHTGFLNFCKFVYFIRDGRHTMYDMINHKYFEGNPERCLLYYCYRLRRLCEMARNTPGAVLLTWNDIKEKKGMDLLKKYLGLMRVPIIDTEPNYPKTSNINYGIIQKADECYERHYYYLKKCDLKLTDRN